MITAPYNFIPLNEKVFYPSWTDDVSHNIPFEDGESGEIDITITAQSHIFVKDYTKKDIIVKSHKFCQYNGQYYIPGSSIKGMVRNICEIISFSKLKLQDKTLSYRDLKNPSYEQNAMNQNRIYMGWLYKDGRDWKIESLGKVTNGNTRIKYKRLEDILGKGKANQIKSKREAYEKYKAINDFSKLNLSDGTVVFTGTINANDKTREFLFPKEVKKTIVLSAELINTFQEAYYIGTPNESKNWKELWKKRFNEGGKVPVFFQMKNDDILHFGLSMLYKLPYKNSLKKLVESYVKDYDDEKLDFCEALFGTEKQNIALKSRVVFSHAKAIDVKLYCKDVSLPLSTPRPTFYPNYLVQCQDDKNKTSRHKTYDDNNSILRGYKIYPPRRVLREEVESKNKNILTTFRPLEKGSTFDTKIRFHNLKKEELGLLCLALTLMNQEDCYHKLGMAKAYGFGTVKISLNSLKIREMKDGLIFKKVDKSIYENDFIKSINEKLNIDLKSHPRIEALKKLTSYTYEDKKLEFMDIKGFTNAKKFKFCLFEVVKNGYDKTNLCNIRNKKVQQKSKKNTSNLGSSSADAFSNMKVTPQRQIKKKRDGLKIVKKVNEKKD